MFHQNSCLGCSLDSLLHGSVPAYLQQPSYHSFYWLTKKKSPSMTITHMQPNILKVHKVWNFLFIKKMEFSFINFNFCFPFVLYFFDPMQGVRLSWLGLGYLSTLKKNHKNSLYLKVWPLAFTALSCSICNIYFTSQIDSNIFHLLYVG